VAYKMQESLMETSGTQRLTKSVERSIRMGFVRKVYSILSFQLLLTCVIAYPVMQQSRSWFVEHTSLFYAVVVVQFVCMAVIACAQQQLRTFPQNYAFLFLFTATEGFLIGMVCAGYTAQSVALAASATVLIFLLMTVYAWTTKSDFSGAGPYFMAMFFTLFSLGFLMFVLSLLGVDDTLMSSLNFMYGSLATMLFTFFIVFDTQKMIGEWGGHKVQFNIDDYCLAALNLYLDIINLFLQILQLFGDKKH